MADVKIHVIGEDQATRELSKIDSSLGGLKKGLGDIAGMFVKATAAAAVVGVTIKQAFDLGKQGAVIMQTEESFARLLEKVDAAPDLLNQLQAASKGTIPDLQLMSSTITLLAGAQGDLATAFAAAAPQLMEISKAAAKLKPELGSAAFAYDSLALGIKRAQPEILDNLMLNIKLTEAYTKYASSLGKSADALSAEERQFALLNATLDAGAVLIDQAGGSTDAATDSFMQLETAVKNVGNALKEDLVPPLTAAFKAAYQLMVLDKEKNSAIQVQANLIRETSASYEEYNERIRELWKWVGLAADQEGNLVDVSIGLKGITKEIIVENALLTEAEWNLIKAYEFHTWVQEQDNEAMAKAANAAEALQAKINEYAAALTKAGMEGQFGKALETYNEQMAKLELQAEDLRVKLAEELVKGFDDTSESVKVLTDDLTDNQRQQEKLAAQTKRTTAEIIYQRVASLLDAESALVLASRMGLITEADYELERQLILLTQRFDENSDGIIDNAEKTDYLVRMSLKLYDQVTKNIDVVDAYAVQLDDLTTAQQAAANEAYRLEEAQNILSASLGGALQGVWEDYGQTLQDTQKEHEALTAEYIKMVASGLNPLSSAFDDINKRLADNIQQQFDLKDALRKTTAEMIYQQASQGLSADASLELAYSMGMISEKDYKVATALQHLRAMYDTNRDGAIDAAEGAWEYIDAVKALYAEVTRLMELGLPFGDLLGVAGEGAAAAPMPGGAAAYNQVTTNIYYQPGISFSGMYEFANMVTPIIEDVLKRHGL